MASRCSKPYFLNIEYEKVMEQSKETKILDFTRMGQFMAVTNLIQNRIALLNLLQLFLSHDVIKRVDCLALSFAFR